MRSRPGANGAALVPVTNPYDFNRDSFVNATDQIIARSNGFILPRINITNPPAAPTATAASAHVATSKTSSAVAPAAATTDDTAAAVALALAASPAPRFAGDHPRSERVSSGRLALPRHHAPLHVSQAIAEIRDRALAQLVPEIADPPAFDDDLLDQLLEPIDA